MVDDNLNDSNCTLGTLMHIILGQKNIGALTIINYFNFEVFDE